MLRIEPKGLRHGSASVVLVVILVCLISILAYAGFFGYPNYKTLKKQKADLIDFRSQIKVHNTLSPFYNELLAETKTLESSVLPFPEREYLSRGEIEWFTDKIRNMAIVEELDFENLVPDVGKSAGPNLLRANLTLKGEFLQLRPFIMKLYNTPQLAQVESIKITATPQKRTFEMAVWLWVK